jgi:hypothetical protein
MITFRTHYFLSVVAILAGLSATSSYSLAKEKKSSQLATASAKSPPYVVTVTANTRITPKALAAPTPGLPEVPSDDKPHCFKADPTRSLIFDVQVKGLAKGTVAVAIFSVDQMQYAARLDQSQPSGAAAGMESEKRQGKAIKDGRVQIVFGGDSTQSGLTGGTEVEPIHLGPLPPDNPAWVPKSGPYSNVALITISAGARGGKRNREVYKFLYSYQLWKNDPSECSLKP